MKTGYQDSSFVMTIIMITICVFTFIIEIFLGGSENVNVLIRLGAKYNPAIDSGEYWRLVTPVFLHIGIVHLVLNMFSLWMLGKIAERMYGHFRFAAIFLISGISGNFASYLLNPNAISAGASTSIYGIIGALLILLILKKHASYTKSIARSFIPMVVINIAFNFVPGSGIDVAGHFGGLASGLVLGALLIFQSMQKKQTSTNGYSDPDCQDQCEIPAKKPKKVSAYTNKYYARYPSGGQSFKSGKKPNKFSTSTNKYYTRYQTSRQSYKSRSAFYKRKYFQNNSNS